MSSTLLWALLLAQHHFEDDPLDGFRANYQSIEVSLDFTYRRGRVASSVRRDTELWRRGTVELADEEPGSSISGRWETNGSIELFVLPPLRAPGDPGQPATPVGNTNPLGNVRSEQYLLDGEVAALYSSTTHTVRVGPLQKLPLEGPFCWFRSKFPEILDGIWKSANVTRFDAQHGGHFTKDVVWLPRDPAYYSLIVAFDPSVGWLPRYARRVSYVAQNDQAVVSEFRLREATRCRTGAFVPSEWIETRFFIPDFKRRHASYDQNTVFDFSGAELYAGHFKAASIRDERPSLTLSSVDGFRVLLASGGHVELPARPRTITMNEIRQALGLKIFATPPVPTLPIVRDELPSRPARTAKVVAALALFTVGCVLAIVAYRRHKTASLAIAATACLLGCGGRPPAIHARFEPDRVLFDPQEADDTLQLRLTNTGGRGLTISAIDGTCRCSVAGPGRFPFRLERETETTVAVRIERRYDFMPQHLTWTVRTDRGDLKCNSELLLVPRTSIYPALRYIHELYEGEAATYEIVVRRVSEDVGFEDFRFAQMEGVAIVQNKVRNGAGPAKGLSFEERTFSVTITDMKSNGPQRRELRAVDKGGKLLATSLLEWKRRPLVSTVPEKVYIAQRKVRVFLRSRDEDIEVVAVRTVPPGLRAFVVAPREVIVEPTPEAAAILDGDLVLETSSPQLPTIRVPVIRRAPTG